MEGRRQNHLHEVVDILCNDPVAAEDSRAAGRGTLAVIDSNDHRILIFPPHSDKSAQEVSYNSANSLTFDRRGHLCIEFLEIKEPLYPANNSCCPGSLWFG